MPPPAPQFPLPPTVSLANVEPGTSAAGEAGAVLRVVGTATATLTGADAGLFRIDGLETLAIVKDPDAPGRAWETVSEVNGPGPVDGGPGFGVTVSFSCPLQPAKEAFTATAVLVVNAAGTSVTHDFAVSATVLPESLTVRLNPPSFFLGESKDIAVTVRSTYRRDIAGLLSFDTHNSTAFTFGNPVHAVTVPRLGEADVTVPAKCSAAATTGDHPLTAVFQPGDTAAPASDTEDARVLEHRAATVTSTFPAQVALEHPSRMTGTLLVSVNSGDPATIFFETVGAPDTVSLTMPQSVTVDRGATVPVAINVNSSVTAFTDAFAPITIAWQIPPDDFHPDDLRGSLVLSEVSFPMRMLTIPSGDLSDDTASGFATVVMGQDGSVNYSGHVHDSGFFGGNFLASMVFPTIVDGQGRSVEFVRTNNIAGTIGGGDSRDDDWNLDGPSDPAIKSLLIEKFDTYPFPATPFFEFDSDLDTDLFVFFDLFLQGIGVTAVVVVLLE